MTLLWASPPQAQPPSAAPNYALDSTWLCLPGRQDVCSTSLPTTALNPNGYGSNGLSTVANDPPVDCFYVYPTVSNDQGLNSDMNAGREEKLATETQFARFASVCRPFVPIYRQMTVASIAAYAAGADITQAGMLAYGDVLAAWRNYIRTRNQGRPFVLIGHSQGSVMLQQLIAREIENDPAVYVLSVSGTTLRESTLIVYRRSCRVFAPITCTSLSSLVSSARTNTIVRPSGDHSNSRIADGSLVTASPSPPSTLIM